MEKRAWQFIFFKTFSYFLFFFSCSRAAPGAPRPWFLQGNARSEPGGTRALFAQSQSPGSFLPVAMEQETGCLFPRPARFAPQPSGTSSLLAGSCWEGLQLRRPCASPRISPPRHRAGAFALLPGSASCSFTFFSILPRLKSSNQPPLACFFSLNILI